MWCLTVLLRWLRVAVLVGTFLLAATARARALATVRPFSYDGVVFADCAFVACLHTILSVTGRLYGSANLADRSLKSPTDKAIALHAML